MRSSPVSELICVGNELLTGHTLNTNARWIAQRCQKISLNHKYQTVVSDSIDDIVVALSTALTRSDIIFISGGLGPTPDDLTHEAVAQALKKPMLHSQKAQKHLEKRLSGLTLSKAQYTQAQIPSGSDLMINEVGTACGIKLSVDIDQRQRTVYTFPGVPAELHAMFLTYVEKPLSHISQKDTEIKPVNFLTFGLRESVLSELLENKLKNTNFKVATYLYRGGVRVFLSIAASTEKNKFDKIVNEIRLELSDYIYSEANQNLEKELFKLLKSQELTVAFAESCTGGAVAAKLTSVAGASQVFEGGIVSYSNNVKASVLGVKRQTLETYGAVSKDTALEMADAAKKLFSTDYAVSVTGVAGPSGGTDEKPVGTVWFGLSVPETSALSKSCGDSAENGFRKSFKKNFGFHTRPTIIEKTVYTAMHALYLLIKDERAFTRVYGDSVKTE